MKKYLLLLILFLSFSAFSQEKKTENNSKPSQEVTILIGPENITEVIGVSISKVNNNKLTLIIVDKDNNEVYKMITPEFTNATFKIDVDNLSKGEYNLKFIEENKLIFEKKFLKE